MDINSREFRTKMENGAEKIADLSTALHTIPHVMQAGADWVHANPATAAATAAILKSHFGSSYGHKIPVVRHFVRGLGQGAMHAGIQHGLRGERLSRLATFPISLVNPDIKHQYDLGREAGEGLKDKVNLNVGTLAHIPIGQGQKATARLKLDMSPEDAMRTAHSLGGAMAPSFKGGPMLNAFNPDLKLNRAARWLTDPRAPGRAFDRFATSATEAIEGFPSRAAKAVKGMFAPRPKVGFPEGGPRPKK